MNLQLPQRYADRAGVNTIREVFDYIRRYRGKTFVLKIEDTLIDHPLFPLLMKDIVQLHDIGIHMIIVAGTRATIEQHLAKTNCHTKVVDGIRITTNSAMACVKLAAMEVAQSIISHLSAGNANGIMGNWIRARALGVRQGLDYQYTGQVEKIQSGIIHKLLAQNFIPVVYNIGMNSTGDFYNLNSDQIARQICLDLNIEKLFLSVLRMPFPPKGLNSRREVRSTPMGKFFPTWTLAM